MRSYKSFLAGIIAMLLALITFGGVMAVFYAGTQQIVSTVTTGTSPFSVTSTTVVSNLNADTVNGVDSSEFDQGCQPYYTEGASTSSTYSSFVSCTNCAGRVLLVRANDGGAANGDVRVTVDGISVVYDESDAGYNGDNPRYTIMRFTSNLTAEVRRSSGTSIYRGAMTYCRES